VRTTLVELPTEIKVLTDERGLMQLVYEASRPETFLALRGLKIEVKDPASGAFEATLELAGVFEGERPAEGTAAPRPPVAPVTDDDRTSIPVRITPRRF
jgi:hypothetical protein